MLFKEEVQQFGILVLQCSISFADMTSLLHFVLCNHSLQNSSFCWKTVVCGSLGHKVWFSRLTNVVLREHNQGFTGPWIMIRVHSSPGPRCYILTTKSYVSYNYFVENTKWLLEVIQVNVLLHFEAKLPKYWTSSVTSVACSILRLKSKWGSNIDSNYHCNECY